MPCTILFSTYASPLNGISYHMVKPRALSSYNSHSAVSIRFKVDSSASHDILSNMPQNFATDHCHSCLESCNKILDRPGRDHNVFLPMSPQGKNQSSQIQWARRPMQMNLDVQSTSSISCIQPLPDIFPTVGGSSVTVKPQPLPHG
jgi:hypothetical protein